MPFIHAEEWIEEVLLAEGDDATVLITDSESASEILHPSGPVTPRS